MTEMRRVTAIRNGTVVDHIPAGHSLQVVQMLRIDMTRATPVSLVMNVPSDKLGRKDVLKVEDRELNQEQLDRLALIAPAASIAIIRNHAVAEKLKVEIEGVSFQAPSPPVVTNVEAAPNADAERIPELLVTQVTESVRFTEMIQRLKADGVTHFLEVGAGRVLSGLLARIDRRSKRESLGGASDLENARNFIVDSGTALS